MWWTKKEQTKHVTILERFEKSKFDNWSEFFLDLSNDRNKHWYDKMTFEDLILIQINIARECAEQTVKAKENNHQ
jgi:hypothetical protein